MAFTVVQSSNTGSFTSNLTAGNGIVAVLQGGTFFRSADTTENFTHAVSGTGGNAFQIWYFSSTKGGYKTFNSDAVVWLLYEVNPAIALDLTHASQQANDPPTWNTGSTGTTTSAVEIWIGGGSAVNVSFTSGVPGMTITTAGFTSQTVDDGFTTRTISAYRAVSATGTATVGGGATWPGSSISDAVDSAIATFKANPAVTVTLTTAQVAIAAGVVAPVHANTVTLATAQVSVQAKAVTPGVVHNLVATVSSASGTDPYGNTYPGGIAAIDGAAYIRMANVGSNPILELFPPVVTKTLFANGQLLGSTLNTGAANEQHTATLHAPQNSGKNAGALYLTDDANDGSVNEQASLGYVNLGGTFVPVAVTQGGTFSTIGNATIGGSFTAQHNASVSGNFNVGSAITATGATQGSPSLITTDSWHLFTPISSWTVGSGGTARYRLNADNTVSLHCTNFVPGTLTTSTPIWTIPAGYIPSSTATQNFPAEVVSTTAQGNTPFVAVRSTGSLTIQNFQANVTNLSFFIRYALD